MRSTQWPPPPSAKVGINSTDQVEGFFDPVMYEKGGAVLRMLRTWAAATQGAGANRPPSTFETKPRGPQQVRPGLGLGLRQGWAASSSVTVQLAGLKMGRAVLLFSLRSAGALRGWATANGIVPIYCIFSSQFCINDSGLIAYIMQN